GGADLAACPWEAGSDPRVKRPKAGAATPRRAQPRSRAGLKVVLQSKAPVAGSLGLNRWIRPEPDSLLKGLPMGAQTTINARNWVSVLEVLPWRWRRGPHEGLPKPSATVAMHSVWAARSSRKLPAMHGHPLARRLSPQ